MMRRKTPLARVMKLLKHFPRSNKTVKRHLQETGLLRTAERRQRNLSAVSRPCRLTRYNSVPKRFQKGTILWKTTLRLTRQFFCFFCINRRTAKYFIYLRLNIYLYYILLIEQMQQLCQNQESLKKKVASFRNFLKRS